MSQSDASQMKQMDGAEQLQLPQHRKSTDLPPAPWGSSAAAAGAAPTLPVMSPAQQYHDFQRHRWAATATSPSTHLGEPGLPSTWGWSGWPSVQQQQQQQQHSHQTAAFETTSPERLALGASSDTPQSHADASRFTSPPGASLSQGFPYLLSHHPQTGLRPSPINSPVEPIWNPVYRGSSAEVSQTTAAPLAIPDGANRYRSLSTSTSSSSTDASSQHGNLLDDLDPTPRAHNPSAAAAAAPQPMNGANRSRSASSVSHDDSHQSFQTGQGSSGDAEQHHRFSTSPSPYGPPLSQPASWFANPTYTASPASSVVSLPNYPMHHVSQQPQQQQHSGSDPSLWTQFNAFRLDSQSELTSPASSTFSEPTAGLPPFSPTEPQDTASAAHDPSTKRPRQRKSANQPEITRDPLFWRSQTTRATKQASIARRKPGSIARFACPYCGECFTRKYNLNGHVRAHKGERPFACDQPSCTKAFSRQHDLKRHRELHATAEKFRCASCFKGFRKVDALARHYRSEPSCVDPYPDLDFSTFPDLYLSTTVLNGADLPNSSHLNGPPISPAAPESQLSHPLPETNSHDSLDSSTGSTTSFESVHSAYF